MGGRTSAASHNKYNNKVYDRVNLVLRKDGDTRKDYVQDAADAAGESINAYITDAIRQRMQQQISDDGQRVHISIGYGTIDAVRLDGETREQAARRILSDALRGK